MNRHAIVSASYLFLEKDEQYFLLRRFNTGYEDGNWTPIAGHVDKSESIRDCIIREAKEEAGVDVLADDLKLIHVLSYKGDDADRAGFFWSCSKWEGEALNMEREKCDQIGWFDKNNLPDNLTQDLAVAIEGIRNSHFYSELNWN